MKLMIGLSLSAALGGLLALGCGNEATSDAASARVPATESALAANPPNPPVAADSNWGTIKGQIIFDGDKIPERKPLDVNKDQDHCLKSGPVHDEGWVVNAKNKGVRWVVAFLKQDAKKPLPVHDKLKAPAGDAVLDQPRCAFEPHVLTMRADQMLLVKNPAPVAHTATIKGFKNDFNPNLAAGNEARFKLEPERNAIQISCGHHPWMRGYLWVFDHPYFATTDADGNFEIKLAPTGPQRLVIWHESIGYLGGARGRDGREIQVKPGVSDVGVIKIKPTE